MDAQLFVLILIGVALMSATVLIMERINEPANTEAINEYALELVAAGKFTTREEAFSAIWKRFCVNHKGEYVTN